MTGFLTLNISELCKRIKSIKYLYLHRLEIADVNNYICFTPFVLKKQELKSPPSFSQPILFPSLKETTLKVGIFLIPVFIISSFIEL